MDLEYHCDDYYYGAVAEPALGLGGRGAQAPLTQELYGKRDMKRKMKLPDAITTTTTTSMDLEYHCDDYCYGGGGASMGTWGRETQAPLHQELGKREMKRKIGGWRKVLCHERLNQSSLDHPGSSRVSNWLWAQDCLNSSL